MKQAVREAFDNKLDQFNTMKNILKAYTSNRECSVQAVVYHILPELHLRRFFPGVQFVNKYLPEERSKIPQTEEQLSSLLIFSKETTLTVTLLDCQSHFVMENT